MSHHVELLLPIAHSLIRIVDGRLDAAGSIDDLRAQGEIEKIVAVEEASHSNEEVIIPPTPAAKEKTEDEAVRFDVPSPIQEEGDEESDETEEEAPKKEARKMVKDEEREVGNVKWATYKVTPLSRFF